MSALTAIRKGVEHPIDAMLHSVLVGREIVSIATVEDVTRGQFLKICLDNGSHVMLPVHCGDSFNVHQEQVQ